MSLYRSLTIATVLALCAVLIPASAGAHKRAPGSCYAYLAEEQAFAQLTNQARSSRSVGKLQLDPQLSWVARTHTRAMDDKGELFHATAPEITHRITHWTTIGENIGVGPADDVAGLQKAFMHSPLHRANLLDPTYKYVGVGVVVDGDTLWVTLDFESAANPGTTLHLPSC